MSDAHTETKQIEVISISSTSTIYVEGVHEDTLRKFEDNILDSDNRQDKIDLLNDMSRFSIAKMGTAFYDLIKESEFSEDVKGDLYKWINDTGYEEKNETP